MGREVFDETALSLNSVDDTSVDVYTNVIQDDNTSVCRIFVAKRLQLE